jgi:hypothetical protein
MPVVSMKLHKFSFLWFYIFLHFSYFELMVLKRRIKHLLYHFENWYISNESYKTSNGNMWKFQDKIRLCVYSTLFVCYFEYQK